MKKASNARSGQMPAKVTDNQQINNYLGSRLRSRRTSLGLSQQALGEAIGIASQQVQKYEKGTNVMSAIRLYEFSNFLKVQISYFYEGLEKSSQQGSSDSSEQTEQFAGEYKTATDRESLEVLKSFKRIKDHSVRKRIADMLRSLSLKNI